MAVTSVVELGDPQRGGEFTGSEVTSTRVWLLTVDSQEDTEWDLLPSLPAYLSPHPGNSYCTLRKLSITNSNPWKGWKAVGTYSTAPLTQAEKEKQEPNPLMRPAKVSVRTRSEQTVRFFDRDGKPYVNTACDYFDPPPEGRKSIRVFSIQKNLADPPSWLLDYDNAVNSDSITIKGVSIAPGFARCGDVSVSETQEENGHSFVVVSLQIEAVSELPSGLFINSAGTTVTPKGWSSINLNQGLRERSGSAADSPLQAILDAKGDPVTQPIALNASGKKLANPTPSNVLYVVNESHKALPFAALPLS